MPDGRAIDSLLDILELIERISRQVAPMMREQFLDDPDVQDATAYRLLAIGEASKDLSDEMKACYPDVPWRQVVGLRNVLADQYFVRESDLIWETVTVGLPRLAEVCRRELRRLGWTADPPAAPVP